MTVLAQLKLTSTKRIEMNDPTVVRRQKLIDKLEEQARLANAMLSGEAVEFKRRVFETDKETGERKQVERAKRVRQWFWHDLEGKWFLEVRYANTPIEFGKDKRTIEVGDKAKLPATIQAIIEAVKAGELDKAIETVAKRRKER